MMQNNVVALGLLAACMGLACDSASADRAPAQPAVAENKAAAKDDTPSKADDSEEKQNKAEDAKAKDPVEGDPKAEDPRADPKSDQKADPKANTGKNKKHKSSKKSTKSQVAPLPPGGSGSGAHGDRCKASGDCNSGLACSGLYHNQDGKCISEAKAKLACEGSGHKWGKWGRAQLQYCMKTMSDGGKKCADSKECEGKCIQATGRSGGVCQTHQTEFGCYAELKNGKAGMTKCLD